MCGFVAVVQHTEFDGDAALRFAVGVGVAQGVGAAAVFLLVEVFAFADFDHARAAAAFAPVEIPIDDVVVGRGGAVAAVVDLRHVFPAGNAQRAGEDGEAVFVGVLGGFFETHVETHGAADAAFGFEFHAFGFGEPFFAVVFVVVVFVDEGDAEFVGEAHVFFFAQHVFFERVDVGIVEVDGVVDAAGEHGFHHFAAARGAAGMQQDFFMAAGRDEDGAVDVGNDGAGFVVHDRGVPFVVFQTTFGFYGSSEMSLWDGFVLFFGCFAVFGVGWRRLGEDAFGVGVCGKFVQQFLVVLGLFHQLCRGSPQVVHVFGREVEAGGDVQHFVAQRGGRQVFEVEADKGKADSVAVLSAGFVAFVDEGTEAALGFLGVLVDGDVDDGGNDVAESGYGGGFVHIAADLVLGVDADDDDVSQVAAADLLFQHFVGIHFGHVQEAAHAEVVG